jgi:pimeloyl-ACP methyl ester carboxylesterase
MQTVAPDIRFAMHSTNGITLHAAEAGPKDGRLVVLLHGFPEFWYGWRHQIAPLAAAGYRVIAPDQRGYNLSSRPAGRANYDLDVLADDVLGLVQGLGYRSFFVVGHDWGATVGWWIASHRPGLLDRFAALAAPHPAVWLQTIHDNPEQRKKSWYVKAFRIPWLPEFSMRQRNFKALADALTEPGMPASATDSDLASYREAWSRPGTLTGMVNWYRALLTKQISLDSVPRIDVPTLVIWGRADKFGVAELAERSRALCSKGSLVYVNCGHFVQHYEPARVNDLLLEFLEDSSERVRSLGESQ